MASKSPKPVILYLGTFPPRECGIATFTSDLTEAFDEMYMPREECKVIAMDNSFTAYNYSDKVLFSIKESEPEEYIAAAKKINEMAHVKLVHIQHEYGIYGGEMGSHLLYFMKEVKKPIILTMHTVLPKPIEKIKAVTIDLCKEADSIVVMTKRSQLILVQDYQVDENKIKIIPHGIHSRPYKWTIEAKAKLELSEKKVLSTFGLLSRGKGIEYAVEALPEVVKKFPDVIYLIIGVTHPSVLRTEGEAYRNELAQRINELGLSKNVIFHNRYRDTSELLQLLEATDIYLSLPLNPNQAVSGTLSYALGAGRTVVATKFAQAEEDVTSEVGMLVDFKEPKQIAAAIISLLSDEPGRRKMGERAYFRTRKMEWRNVIISYMKEYLALVPELGLNEKNLPAIKLQQLVKLTDDFGVMQFAKFSEPDPEWGYTVDDNARALIALVEYQKKNDEPACLKLIDTYLKFVEYCATDGQGFRNYVNYDKTFHLERNTKEDLSDANSRALYALARAGGSESLPASMREKARRLLQDNLYLEKKVVAFKSSAFYVKALYHFLDFSKDKKVEEKLKEYADNIVKIFEENSLPEWQWFEEKMTYSNGLLPEALLLAYKKIPDPRYLEVARASLDFLLLYSFNDLVCVPIGQNGWFTKGKKKYLHDQQPEEVAALVEVLKLMYEITREEKYKTYMKAAFNWFLGNNLLGQVVYDQTTGGCFDGIGEKEVNLNQGAESTISYLLARLAMENV